MAKLCAVFSIEKLPRNLLIGTMVFTIRLGYIFMRNPILPEIPVNPSRYLSHFTGQGYLPVELGVVPH